MQMHLSALKIWHSPHNTTTYENWYWKQILAKPQASEGAPSIQTGPLPPSCLPFIFTHRNGSPVSFQEVAQRSQEIDGSPVNEVPLGSSQTPFGFTNFDESFAYRENAQLTFPGGLNFNLGSL